MSWSTGSGTGADDESELPGAVVDHLPGVLRSRPAYRLVLSELVEREGACSLAELTRHLVESDAAGATDATADSYRLTHLSLVREYLPVLEEFDAVAYDEEMGQVSLTVPAESR